MATIKTTGAGSTLRVLTKTEDGVRRVSCTCCEAVAITCCILDTEIDLTLYPSGAITQDKLPPTIVLDGNALSLGTLGYGNTTNGAFLEGGVWAVYKSEVRTTRRCLISNIATDIEDEFPETLTATYSNFGLTVTAPLTRTSLCIYEGIFTYDGFDWDVKVYHNALAQTNGNVWTLLGPIIAVADFGDGPEPFLQGSNFSTNTSNQPANSYSGEFGEDIDSNPIIITATVT